MSLATRWKSAEEIRFSLQDIDRVGIISCDICANFCETGGVKGMRYMKGLLEEWGKTVVMQKCVLGCCSEEIMRQALRIKHGSLTNCEALVVLGCSAGVQNIITCDTGKRVVGALDTVGSAVITRRRDSPKALSICTFCGQCVIAYTGGICPVYECPKGQLYGPCDDYDEADGRCVAEPGRQCVWKEIGARWDEESLREIKRLREEGDGVELHSTPARTIPLFARKMLGWLAVRLSDAHLGTFFGWIR
jgi:ferredoxin